MASIADTRRDGDTIALAGIPVRTLADARSTSATSSSRTTTPYDGDELVPRAGPPRGRSGSGTRLQRAVRRGAQEGRARHLADAQLHHRARARLHRPRPRDHRRPADRGAAEAGDHAERRLPHGAPARSRPTATSPIPHVVEAFTKYRKTHNDAVFDAYTADIRAVPQLAHPHRPARRLRARPHHRRLPPRRAVRRRRGSSSTSRRRSAELDAAHVHRRDHPRPRGTGRADPRAEGAAADGGGVRLRHLAPGRRARAKRCSGSTSATWRR